MKILVGYSSKHGATKDAATHLAEKLQGQIDLCDLNERQPDPAGFDMVLLGGAVYAGTLPKPLKKYCEANATALAQKPLGLFVCCSEGDATGYLSANLPKGLVETARQAASFGGEFRAEKLNVFERTLLKMVTKANGGKSLPSLDHEAIGSFAAAMQAAA